MSAFTRRGAMAVLGGAIGLLTTGSLARAQGTEVTKEMILNDPAAPTGGNPNGDVTIVNFTDYNCPYCKQVAPILARVIEEDGRIRHVYKDWPVIRPTSIDGARLALAAHHQRKYEAAHAALMGIPGSGIAADQMRSALGDAGIDMARLDIDLSARSGEIENLIKRNLAQGDALGLTGTPSFLIGPFRLSVLDYDGFKQVIADARASQQDKNG